MKPDKNKELMLTAGSKTGAYDIEAPDQWRWVMLHANDPLERAMAWVKSKTTAFRHESPFCVDEHGKPVYVQHLAAEMGWKIHTAQNVLCELESQGRIRLEKGKRIWYCADVPTGNPDDDPPPPLAPEEEERRKKSKSRASVQRSWGTYVADFIANLPEEKQPEVFAKLETCVEWRREFFADGMAAMRNIADRVDDTTLREIGIPKKRLPKRRESKCKWVQIKLFAEPAFVQSSCAEFVQNADSTSYKPETDFVDARAVVTSTAAATESAPRSPSGVPLSKEQPTTTTTLDAPPSGDDVVVAERLGIKKTAAQKFLTACRKASPGCTVEEITAVIDHVDGTINRTRIKNPTGVLLENVPLKIAAYQKDQAENQSLERRMAARKTAPPFSVDTLRSYLESNAATVPYPVIAKSLKTLAADAEKHFQNLEELEQRLTVLEERMVAEAKGQLTAQERTEMDRNLERQLKPYRGKMTADQLARLENQYRDRGLLEKVGLPRLSLFYREVATGKGASGDD